MWKKPPNSEPGNYAVGRGRPPISTRWRPGQSGNPKGRPKGRKNAATLLNEALDQKLEIQEKGRTRQITAREGIARRYVNEALKGNLKAAEFIFVNESAIAEEVPFEELEMPHDPVKACEAYQRMISAGKETVKSLNARSRKIRR